MKTHESVTRNVHEELESTNSLVPGKLIGDRYRIEEELGSGGMGLVFRATHLALQMPVAIKLIRPDFGRDAEFVRRFLDEARRAALLSSERIARVHDVGQLASGEPFLVMELLEGIELAKELDRYGALPPEDAVAIALQILEGLAEAHANGIVHRDIKPGNVFLVRRPGGRFAAKILDFGISKQLGAAPNSLTDTGRSLGSPWYSSPEQMLDASRVDHRTDIWSLGVVLFEMLTGRRPFDGGSIPEICARALTRPAPSIRRLRPTLDPELEAIVARCLAKRPKDRYSDVAAIGADLHRYLGHAGALSSTKVEPTTFFQATRDHGSIAPVSAITRASLWRRKRRAHRLGGAGLLLTLGVAALAVGPRLIDVALRGGPVLPAGLASPRSNETSSRSNEAAPPKPVTESRPPAVAAPSAAPSASVGPLAAPRPAAALPALPTGVSASAPAPTAPSRPHAATTVDASSPPVSPPVSTAAMGARRIAKPQPVESPVTEEEIEARAARYEQWLAGDGEEPLDGPSDNPSSDNPSSDNPSNDNPSSDNPY